MSDHENDPIVICGMARTPMGAMMGALADVAAPELGAVAIKAALEDAGAKPDEVEAAFMGCVLPAGQGQAPARQAALAAGCPLPTTAVTLNKMCGSGMQAAMMAHDMLRAGSFDVIVAGGMESMTNAPYLLPKARGGYRYGHDTMYDHMALDGLEDAYDKGRSMGTFAEDTAQAYQFTREAQDAYALETLRRAQASVKDGVFDREIAPVTVKSRQGDIVVDKDETPMKAKAEKIPTLRTPFKKDGTVTAASSSPITDGASALVMTRLSVARKRGYKVIARLVAHAAHAQEPAKFTTAPIPASRKALDKAGWTTGDVDLFEVNEAFAVVPMAWMKDMGVPHDVLNVNGGACALGHPIGASGARIMTTLLSALEAKDAKRGLAAICIGGGEGTAVALERVG